MKIHLFELEQAIHADEDWREAVSALRGEIEPHAREEEDVEFPRLREALNQAQTTQLNRKIRQEEALLVSLAGASGRGCLFSGFYFEQQ